MHITEINRNICHIYIQHQGRGLEADVLIDTGNRLWDARFNRPVMLLSEELVKELVSPCEYHLIMDYKMKGYIDYNNPILLSAPKTGFHEITFQSLGKMSGKIICFLLEEVRVPYASNKKKSCGEKKHYYKQPCAVADAKLFIGKEYNGLLFPDNI